MLPDNVDLYMLLLACSPLIAWGVFRMVNGASAITRLVATIDRMDAVSRDQNSQHWTARLNRYFGRTRHLRFLHGDHQLAPAVLLEFTKAFAVLAALCVIVLPVLCLSLTHNWAALIEIGLVKPNLVRADELLSSIVLVGCGAVCAMTGARMAKLA